MIALFANYKKSSDCGAFSTNTGSFVDITNFSFAMKATGRPILFTVVSSGSNSGGFGGDISYGTSSGGVLFNFLRGASVIGYSFLTTNDTNHAIPVSALSFIDQPSAGTYTYKLQVKTSNSGSGSVSISYACLMGVEL